MHKLQSFSWKTKSWCLVSSWWQSTPVSFIIARRDLKGWICSGFVVVNAVSSVYIAALISQCCLVWLSFNQSHRMLQDHLSINMIKLFKMRKLQIWICEVWLQTLTNNNWQTASQTSCVLMPTGYISVSSLSGCFVMCGDDSGPYDFIFTYTWIMLHKTHYKRGT